MNAMRIGFLKITVIESGDPSLRFGMTNWVGGLGKRSGDS
jgi:hypothetical protein